MSLSSYSALALALQAKTRGRPHEAKINTRPTLWASFVSADIAITFEPRGSKPVQVALLHPDNSMVIDIHGYHTPTTCKILSVLMVQHPRIYKKNIWLADGFPVRGLINLNSERRVVVPKDLRVIGTEAAANLKGVTPADYSHKARLMLELGTWKPRIAITKRVVAYALGNCAKADLSDAELATCMERRAEIIHRCAETLL